MTMELGYEIAWQEVARRTTRTHPRVTAMDRRPVPQCAPHHGGLARPERSDADAERGSVRRWGARAAKVAPIDEPAGHLAQAASQRSARHMARAFHAPDRDRWPPSAYRSGLGTARIAITVRRSQAVPARACAASRHAAAGSRDRLARPLRPSRLPDYPPAGEARRAVRDVA